MNYTLRVRTFYHLYQILFLIDFEKHNDKYILIIEGNDLLPLSSKLEGLSIFDEIHYISSISKIEKIFTILLCIFQFNFQSKYLIYTCHHSYGFFFLKYLFNKKKLYILEDGFSSYQIDHLGQPNSIFTKNIITRYYYLCFKNPRIDAFFYKKYFDYNSKKIIINNLSKPNTGIPVFSKIIEYLFKINLNFKSNSIIIITQPIYEDGYIDFEEENRLLLKLKDKLFELDPIKNDYKIFLKPHPREKNLGKYKFLKKYFQVEIINKLFPFELFDFYKITFKYGITFFSTAIDSDSIQNKIKINVNFKK